MNSWVVIFSVLHYVGSIRIGSIHNVSFTLKNSSSLNIINGTTQTCLCKMLESSNISAFNYYSNNTCQLFSNTSLINASYSWISNDNTLFYFLYLPTRATVTSQATTVGAISTTIHLSTSTASTKTSAITSTMAVIVPTTVAGTGVAGSSMQQLNDPNDIFIIADGTLYVADYNNSRVQIFKLTNTIAMYSQKGMIRPLSVYVDNASNYYVAEFVSTPLNRVSKWPLNQTILTYTGAYGIAMDSGRNLYISTLNNTIIYWNATSNITTIILSASSGLNGARHISLDEDNQALYIADTLNNRIVKLRLDVGNFTVVAGGNGNGTAANQLNNPAGVCVSKLDGTIYVADTFNNRIQKYIANRTVGSTILGNANGTPGSGIYQLNTPYAVALDPPEQFLYVVDSYNHRIQRIALS